MKFCAGSSIDPMESVPGSVHVLGMLARDRQYFIARVKVILDQILHPNAPLLTREAREILSGYIEDDMQGVEFGSGRSTKWLAQRLSRLVSIEDDGVWYERVKRDIAAYKVDYRLVTTQAGCTAYVDQLRSFPDATFDVILIDGACRDVCIAAAAARVKPGGSLLWTTPTSCVTLARCAVSRVTRLITAYGRPTSTCGHQRL